MNLFDSHTLVGLLFGRHLERTSLREVSRHPGSKPPPESERLKRERHKRERMARQRQQWKDK